MAHLNPLPSAKYLHDCFTYNARTGKLRWKKRPRSHFARTQTWKMWNTRFAKTIAGVVNDKYYQVCLDYCAYASQNIVWKMVTGKEPKSTVDHKNKNGFDNRWVNLREATKTEQQWNICERTNNTSGYKGVHPSGTRWRARIKIGSTNTHLGIFDTAKQAGAVYKAAARKVHGKFYRAPRR